MTQWGLDTLFNPAKRHMDEEKRRLQSTRVQINDSSGGKRIDLNSGKVTIQRDADDEPAEADTAADQPAEPVAPKAEPVARKAETDAQRRARERRARAKSGGS